jgi:hypothetical protein
MKNLVFVAFAFAFVLLVIATLVATCYPRWVGQNIAYGALAVAVAIALISGTWFAHHLGMPRSAYIMEVYVACTCLPLIAGWWNETAEKKTAEKKTAGGSAQAIPHGGKEDKMAERFAQAVPQVLKALIDAAKELLRPSSPVTNAWRPRARDFVYWKLWDAGWRKEEARGKGKRALDDPSGRVSCLISSPMCAN